MKKLFLKDKNQRYSFYQLEKKIYILKYIFVNINLNLSNYIFLELINLNSFFNQTKIRNRCLISNRARGIYKEFKISRLFLKKYALQGKIIGVRKAS